MLGWFNNLPGFLYVQAFSGWGETLLEYNVKSDPQVRIGISVTRDTWSEGKSR